MSISDNLKDHILDSIAEAVFTVDKDFKVNFFNKAAERITGYTPNDIIGKYCKDVFRSKKCLSDCPLSLVFKSQTNLYDFETMIKTADNTIKPIKLNAAVLYNKCL